MIQYDEKYEATSRLDYPLKLPQSWVLKNKTFSECQGHLWLCSGAAAVNDQKILATIPHKKKYLST